MAGNTQKCISTCTEDPELPYLPSRSTRACIDKADGLESCPGLLSVHIHIHGDADNSKRPAKMAETPDLPARGAELHRNVPERLANRMCQTCA